MAIQLLTKMRSAWGEAKSGEGRENSLTFSVFRPKLFLKIRRVSFPSLLSDPAKPPAFLSLKSYHYIVHCLGFYSPTPGCRVG